MNRFTALAPQILLAISFALVQSCGAQLAEPAPAEPAKEQPAAKTAESAKPTATKEASSPNSQPPASQPLADSAARPDEGADGDQSAKPSAEATGGADPKLGEAAPGPSTTTVIKQEGSTTWGRDLVGSCRLYFPDGSVRCREIYGSSRARFIEIFIRKCHTGAGDYDGVWSEQSCPLDLADRERVGGCLTEDPDYATIAYSYIDPHDALAKGLVPLVRTQCLGTYIPAR